MIDCEPALRAPCVINDVGVVSEYSVALVNLAVDIAWVRARSVGETTEVESQGCHVGIWWLPADR